MFGNNRDDDYSSQLYIHNKSNQLQYELRSCKQKLDEILDIYNTALEKLWKNVNLHSIYSNTDKIKQSIDRHRSKFQILVQLAMPISLNEAVQRAKEVE
ncbi:6826_t:CDS:2 [Gigaspora margarita]|uniref:6826_t:CDS:1 n=1 Tax=Gigaspora margarita TaxID=4874 RepID=A0ABN7VPY0_GIGMA|nr:6826_t:CDS:2 [Gigaspora margarita]